MSGKTCKGGWKSLNSQHTHFPLPRGCVTHPSVIRLKTGGWIKVIPEATDCHRRNINFLVNFNTWWFGDVNVMFLFLFYSCHTAACYLITWGVEEVECSPLNIHHLKLRCTRQRELRFITNSTLIRNFLDGNRRYKTFFFSLFISIKHFFGSVIAFSIPLTFSPFTFDRMEN